MIKELDFKSALLIPQVRESIPKELIRELSKDDDYIARLEIKDGILKTLEIGYASDDWKLQ